MIDGGQSFVSSPPAFSSDAKKLLVCTANTVSIFSTSTGLQITELEGHTDRVTSVFVVPVPAGPASKLTSFCWTSSLDGTICYWDFAAPTRLRRLDVKLPVFYMVIPNISSTQVRSNDTSSDLYAFISVESTTKPAKPVGERKAPKGEIRVFNLTTGHRVGGVLAEIRHHDSLTASKNGEFIGSLWKRKLHIWRIPSKDFNFGDLQKIRLQHTKNLTAFAFHPTEKMVAGGDITGRILLWRSIGKKRFSGKFRHTSRETIHEEEKPGVRGSDDADSCSTWHWHPSEVKVLFFSSDGAYLFSGGKEGVIVVWQIDTGKKKYKPRLGSPLLFFRDSPDPTISCISCADNRIHLLKMPSMEIIRSISGIKLPFSFPDVLEKSHNKLAFDCSAGLLALPTEDYNVQFFSLFDNLEVSQVQVCERNFQPVDDVTVFVALVALSIDASMMATVDVKLPEERLGGFPTLKFWTRGYKIGEYALSTVIYEPHSDAVVSSLTFRPGHAMTVSSSFGGDFKVWVHSSDVQQKEMPKKSGWRCQSIGSYKKKPMTAATFSADGTVLAVAAETVVTLWDPDKNVLVAVIGDTPTPITTLSFIGKSEYLVSVSRGSMPELTVWSLSKLSVYWSYKLIVEAVCSTENGSHFAVLAIHNVSGDTTVGDQDGVIILFSAEDPAPVATWLAKKASGGGLAFITENPSYHDTEAEERASLMLAYVNSDRQYIVFDPYSSAESHRGRNSRRRQIASEETEPFGYASIYGILPEFKSKKDDTLEIPFIPSERPWETIFSGSSHVLPPLTKLCSTFLASLLEKRPSAEE